MRIVPDSITDAWLGGEFTGNRQPMARVTLQRFKLATHKVSPTKLYAMGVFAQPDIPRELPNVKSVEWDRSLGADVANCTIVFYNTAPLPLGHSPVTGGDFDLPGYYTYNYGATSWSSSRWGQHPNTWADWLVPDRLLRTYEGYGFDRTKIPELDPHLVQTGMWLIDDVEYTHDGLITVTCRDLGRLLLDQLMCPPVIPLANYPLSWEPTHAVPDADVVQTIGLSFRPLYGDDSGVPYLGANASIHGHKPSDAFDANDKTYWLSIGNALPHAGYSYEWVEGNLGGATLSTVTIKVYGGPYRVYLSVKSKGVWAAGRGKIPYDPNNPVSAPNHSDITFSMVATVGHESTHTFKLAHPVTDVDAIRVTFTGLYNSGIGPYRYRAGLRSISCTGQAQVTVSPGTTHIVGNFDDYTDIVKYLLATGGWFWPEAFSLNFMMRSNGVKDETFTPGPEDPVVKQGRVWGDLMVSGTKALNGTKIGETQWDKKPLMDGIAFVRDLLGFIFFIDETGGAVFRLPNIYSLGNYIGNYASTAGYDAGNIITVDERQVILGLRAKISSKNLRDYYFVTNATGLIGAASAGFNPIRPNPNLRRVAGWTDQNWKDATEAQRMADFIAISAAFLYRQNTLTIVANPAIQIDDQIRIFERTTGDGFYHYVKSIKSTNDLESGKWTYDLTTNWLGEDPEAPFVFGSSIPWAFDKSALATVTKDYMAALLGARPTV